MPSSATRLALVLAVVLGTRPAAFAQSQSPITINSCNVLQGQSGPSIGGFAITQSSAGLHIEFVNESNKTANLVNFAVDSNGQHFVIRDVGTFSPGVSIKHDYRNGAGQSFVLPAFIAPKVTCDVASVRFSDDSVWERGQPALAPQAAPTAPALQITANPPALSLNAGAEGELFTVVGHGPSGFKEIDTCAGIATVSVAATGESTIAYSVRPLAAGTCAAHVIDEDGHTVDVPISVK
jgi:hypothetical protein